MPDRLSEKNYYAVEHYKPKNKFPALINEYLNLFYACGTCNINKGPFWPDAHQRTKGIFIPNPCDHRMHEHLRSLPDGNVDPHSLAGKWTIDLLRLNEPLRVEARYVYLQIRKNTEIQKRKLLTTLQELRDKRESCVDDECKDLDLAIEQTQYQLNEAEKILNYIGD